MSKVLGIPAVAIVDAGTGVATALTTNVGSAGAFVTNGGALGTPSSGTLTNCSGLAVATGIAGLGTGVATFLATPSSANLAAAVTDETGSGALVFATSPTLTTPNIGTPSFGLLTNCTSLPISTGVAGLGGSVATALAVSVGSSGAVVVNGGVLGTPSSGTLTNCTGLPATGISGLSVIKDTTGDSWTSDTTLSGAGDLTVSGLSNSTEYVFNAWLPFDCASAGGFKSRCQINSATSFTYRVRLYADAGTLEATARYTANTGSTGDTGFTAGWVEIQGTVLTAASGSPSIAVLGAQQTSNGTASTTNGGYIWVIQAT